MPVLTSAYAPLLTPELEDIFIDAGEESPLQYPFWINVDMGMPWNPIESRQFASLASSVSMTEGENFTRDRPLVGGTKTFTATPYGLAFEASLVAQEDDQYDLFNAMAGELGRSQRDKAEVRAASVLNNAFDTAFLGYTAGESLCSTSHARVDAGTAQANKPTVETELSQTGVQNEQIRLRKLVSERGLKSPMRFRQAIVPTDLLYRSREVFGSPLKPDTANNEINALVGDDFSVLIYDYLTNAKRWFLSAGKGVHDCWLRWRSQPRFATSTDPNNLNMLMTTWMRLAEGFRSWKGIAGSNPA